MNERIWWNADGVVITGTAIQTATLKNGDLGFIVRVDRGQPLPHYAVVSTNEARRMPEDEVFSLPLIQGLFDQSGEI